MDDETSRILKLASAYPLLGIDAVRAKQIADECSSLGHACDAATRRFSLSDTARFNAILAASAFPASTQ